MDNLLSGLVGAIIGAIVGGLVTYWALTRLESKRVEEIVRRLHALLMLEIAGHQASLARTIDSAMPTWLRRGEAGDSCFFESLGLPLAQFSVSYFRTFLEKLVHSSLLASLAQYYDSLGRLNSYSSDLARGQVEKKDFTYMYMPEACNTLNFSIGLMEELITTKGIDTYLTGDHRRLISNFNEQKPWYKYLTMLSLVRVKHLWALKVSLDLSHLESAKPDTFKELLGDKSLHINVALLDEIPKMIKEDPQKVWEGYLVAANNLE